MSAVDRIYRTELSKYLAKAWAEIEYRSWFDPKYWFTDADIEYLSWTEKLDEKGRA